MEKKYPCQRAVANLLRYGIYAPKLAMMRRDIFMCSESPTSIWILIWSWQNPKSSDNPVYYIQYAHARICSVFRQIEEQGHANAARLLTPKNELLKEPQELELLKSLARVSRSGGSRQRVILNRIGWRIICAS